MKIKNSIILIVVLLLLLIVFLGLREFTVKKIVIIGNKNLTDKEIMNILSIKEGSSIFYPSLKTLYERLRKTPWIKDAIIRKDLNGTITIYIKESNPVAIAMFNQNYYLIDYEAQILENFTEKLQKKHLAEGDIKDSIGPIFLPLIKDIDLFENRETLIEAVKLINFINSRGFVKSNDKIVITGNNPDDLTLYINNFPLIVGKGDFETKFAKYLVVNAEIQRRGIEAQYIDLRVPDRVIVKPVE